MQFPLIGQEEQDFSLAEENRLFFFSGNMRGMTLICVFVAWEGYNCSNTGQLKIKFILTFDLKLVEISLARTYVSD